MKPSGSGPSYGWPGNVATQFGETIRNASQRACQPPPGVARRSRTTWSRPASDSRRLIARPLWPAPMTAVSMRAGRSIESSSRVRPTLYRSAVAGARHSSLASAGSAGERHLADPARRLGVEPAGDREVPGEKLARDDRDDRHQPVRDAGRQPDPDRPQADRLLAVRQDDQLDSEVSQPLEQAVDVGRGGARRGDREDRVAGLGQGE